MSKYRHIFFDLDHTLWDHDRNSHESLTEIYDELRLERHDVSIEEFVRSYIGINRKFWKKYREYKIKKDRLRVERFLYTFSDLNISEDFDFKKMSDRYLDLMTTKNHLFPNAMDLLKYLSKSYELHIITNGFFEVQHRKIKNSGIMPFFKEIIISEVVGKHKPHKKVFDYAIEKSNASKQESIMIGDNLEADILGAKSAGIDQIYFNPEKRDHSEQITFEIGSLEELKQIL